MAVASNIALGGQRLRHAWQGTQVGLPEEEGEGDPQDGGDGKQWNDAKEDPEWEVCVHQQGVMHWLHAGTIVML